mgnify:FL=1
MIVSTQPATQRQAHLKVVEHSAGPSAPPRYSNGYRPSGPSPYGPGPDISDVEFEGYEVDEDEEQPAHGGMVQAVSHIHALSS